MLVHNHLAALFVLCATVDAVAVKSQRREPLPQNCLQQDLIQSSSTRTGQEDGTVGVKIGQSPSKVDGSNFINYCAGKTLTNGQQLTTSSCNGIPQGQIPAKTNMVAAIILYPQPGDRILSDTTFNATIQTVGLRAGYLVNPTTNYYTAPQELDKDGYILGHCHVTIQNIGSLRTTTVPDPQKFSYFKGVDDAGDGQGLLQANIQGGLPVGFYRICTMTAARNHQPVAMPVAQRGPQDDCTKFEVVKSYE